MKIEFKTYLDKNHRYQLVRGDIKKVICFLMLNPSKADGINDDPTIRRLKKFMSDLGYTGFIVVNLCSFIASSPKKLYNYINRENNIKGYNKLSDTHIKYAFKISKTIVAAYGVLKKQALQKRAEKILKMTDKPIYALKLTKNGFPAHPLYLKKDCSLITFKKKHTDK